MRKGGEVSDYKHDGLYCARCGAASEGWGKCLCWAVDMQDGIPAPEESTTDQIDNLVERSPAARWYARPAGRQTDQDLAAFRRRYPAFTPYREEEL